MLQNVTETGVKSLPLRDFTFSRDKILTFQTNQLSPVFVEFSADTLQMIEWNARKRVPGKQNNKGWLITLKKLKARRKTGAKGGKTCKRCQARENMQPVSSAGKHATGVKRRKKCNRCQTKGNTQPVPSAKKHVTGGNCGKTYNRCDWFWSSWLVKKNKTTTTTTTNKTKTKQKNRNITVVMMTKALCMVTELTKHKTKENSKDFQHPKDNRSIVR